MDEKYNLPLTEGKKCKMFIERGVWDKNLFDGKLETSFDICRRWPDRSWAGPGPWDPTINDGSLRVDFGQPTVLDRLVLRKASEDFKPTKAEVSADLKTWELIGISRENDHDFVARLA